MITPNTIASLLFSELKTNGKLHQDKFYTISDNYSELENAIKNLVEEYELLIWKGRYLILTEKGDRFDTIESYLLTSNLISKTQKIQLYLKLKLGL